MNTEAYFNSPIWSNIKISLKIYLITNIQV